MHALSSMFLPKAYTSPESGNKILKHLVVPIIFFKQLKRAAIVVFLHNLYVLSFLKQVYQFDR